MAQYNVPVDVSCLDVTYFYVFPLSARQSDVHSSEQRDCVALVSLLFCTFKEGRENRLVLHPYASLVLCLEHEATSTMIENGLLDLAVWIS